MEKAESRCHNNKIKKALYLWDSKFTKLAQSDQISRSAVSDSLRPHESQQARTPCPSTTPGVH